MGGVNVMPDAELAYEQMCETKQIFGKELGRQGYHVVLSCPVGEGDSQNMYQLTQEFIEEYLVNHKIESADEMLDCYAQIKEKIADISAEQKMIYAENRKLGRLPEDESEIIR